MIKICFIRHGETDWLKNGRVQGWANNPLNDTGVIQILNTVDKLKSHSWDVVVSSDTKRAYDSAKIITSELDLPLVTTPFLRERGWGSAEGKIKENIPNDLEADAETLKEFTRRVIRFREFLQEVALLYNSIIVVSHIGFLRCYMAQNYKVRIDEWNNGDYKIFGGG